jgi:hypothetical protein
MDLFKLWEKPLSIIGNILKRAGEGHLGACASPRQPDQVYGIYGVVGKKKFGVLWIIEDLANTVANLYLKGEDERADAAMREMEYFMDWLMQEMPKMRSSQLLAALAVAKKMGLDEDGGHMPVAGDDCDYEEWLKFIFRTK